MNTFFGVLLFIYGIFAAWSTLTTTIKQRTAGWAVFAIVAGGLFTIATFAGAVSLVSS